MIATPSPVAREVPVLGYQLRMLVAMKNVSPRLFLLGSGAVPIELCYNIILNIVDVGSSMSGC